MSRESRADGPAAVRILGIDPGSRKTGYGVIERRGGKMFFVACGVIRVESLPSFPERLKAIHDGLIEVIDQHRPAHAAVEDIFLARNPQAALKLGQARGAAMVALMARGLSPHEFSAKLVKQAVAGYGQAAKAQVQHMVRVLLGLASSPSEDAADGLAVAICLASHLDTLALRMKG